MKNMNGKNIDYKEVLSKLGPLLALVLVSIALSLGTEQFMTVGNITNIMRQASINSLIAAGMMMVILTGGIDLSVGSITAFAACVMGVMIKNGIMNPVLLIAAGFGSGTFVGYINGILLTKLRLPHPFISTIGTRNIFRGLALLITAASPISGFPKAVQYPGTGDIVFGIPVSFIIVIVMYLGIHIFLNKTALGRHIYAVGGNKEAARLSGLNVNKILVIVYAICGFMCAFAALVMVGRLNTAFPLAGSTSDMDAIASCIIGGVSFLGGKGTIWGTLIGSLLITVLRNGLNLIGASADMQLVVIGLVIIVAVYVDVLRARAEAKSKRLAAKR
ncbi:MAG: ABC transporter permease [Spirochaetia bacterium]|jgi:ribose transport system permease protein|nr:ABC transporter permease [Spirochaetia bacterium]